MVYITISSKGIPNWIPSWNGKVSKYWIIYQLWMIRIFHQFTQSSFDDHLLLSLWEILSLSYWHINSLALFVSVCLLCHSGDFSAFPGPPSFFQPQGLIFHFLRGGSLAQMCVILRFPLGSWMVGGGSSWFNVGVSGEESYHTINWAFVKNTGMCTRPLAPQRFAFCFANIRIFASRMERPPSTSSSWSQKAATLDYLEIIHSLGRFCGLFISLETRPTQWFQEHIAAQFEQTDKLWKLELCGSSPSPFSATHSFLDHIGLQPPKTFPMKGNRT